VIASGGVPPKRILVAGGSIGGLTTALLLSELGHDVEVFERAGAALQDRGAGIVVLPITERYFVESSGADSRVSLELTNWQYVDRSGRVISSDADHFRFAGWSTIYRALLERFDPDRYHLASEVVDFEDGPNEVTISLHDGRTASGALLICADGLASTARSKLLPDVEPVYAGYVAWRGTVDEHRLTADARRLLADAMVYQVLDHGHILAYAMPNRDGSIAIGDRVINWVWYRNAAPDGTYRRLMTDRHGTLRPTTMPGDLMQHTLVEELHEAAGLELAPALEDVVTSSDDILIQAIFDLEVDRMVFGRACLLGDAAFGLRPHVAAGQAKACADAWALRDSFAAADDLDEALANWERSQLELGRAAVNRTKQMGHASQVAAEMVPGDPAWKFGLWEPGN
jgi:2,6-dihydroxypyridine 3-monooxygenase